jgi:hypothetical protein
MPMWYGHNDGLVVRSATLVPRLCGPIRRFARFFGPDPDRARRRDRPGRRQLERRGSPFAWVKTADEILAKAVRKRPATSESRH